MGKDTGGNAFPTNAVYESEKGMTLRDYFAAKALQGLAAKPGAPDYEYEAMAAYKYADAMLKARNA